MQFNCNLVNCISKNMVNKVYFSLSQLGSNVVTAQLLDLKKKDATLTDQQPNIVHAWKRRCFG